MVTLEPGGRMNRIYSAMRKETVGRLGFLSSEICVRRL